jgi:hypothetical protein
VQVTVLNGTTVVAQGQVIASGATATLTGLAAYSAQSGYTVQATVGGWNLPTTWFYTPPVVHPAISCRTPANPAATCTATITSLVSSTNPTRYRLSVTVSTTSTGWVAWEVTVNLSHSSYPFVANSVSVVTGDLIKVSANECTASPRLLVVAGSKGNFDDVRSSTPRSFALDAFAGASGTFLTCP